MVMDSFGMIKCGCCGRNQTKCNIRKPLPGGGENWGLPKFFCSDCMEVWFEGETEPKKIKEIVLKDG